MHRIDITADELVSALLALAAGEAVCILDSCGVGHLGSHLLIAGIDAVETIEVSNENADETLRLLDQKLTGELAAIFTISYDFGLKLFGFKPTKKTFASGQEPDVFLSCFDVLIVHDYDAGTTYLVGNTEKFDSISDHLSANISNFKSEISNSQAAVTSNFTKAEYLETIETIKECIRRGETYQTNLTQQLSAILPDGMTPASIFGRLRRDHPAPFSAFIKRHNSTVVSASPERFFIIGRNPTGREGVLTRKISTSPIKGTRPHGNTVDEDNALRHELLTSKKDRAENTMIVDLLRNDLGRVCEYGTVHVEKLCDLEEHPTLFHLVSTISGDLRRDAKISDILRAVFPCGSITGAPKISTMRIIDEIETANRGLSMGAIGVYVPCPMSNVQSQDPPSDFGLGTLDIGLSLSVAIRTMVVRDKTAAFNVGGGIVIDSDPEKEYDETLLKAKALIEALGVRSEFQL